MQEKLKSAEAELEKKDKELQRLREHLIQVEDTYIKEAIEAGIFTLIYNILFFANYSCSNEVSKF